MGSMMDALLAGVHPVRVQRAVTVAAALAYEPP